MSFAPSAFRKLICGPIPNGMIVHRPLIMIAGTVAGIGTARASPGEWQFSASGAYASIAIDNESRSGIALGVRLDRGVRGPLFVSTSIGASAYPSGSTAHSEYALVGFKYLFSDVLKYVPFGTLDFGAVFLGGEAIETVVRPRFQLGLGADLLVSESFSWGLLATFEISAPQAAFAQTNLFTLGASLAWRWGFF